MYSPRCISIGAGLAETAPAFQVNRLCGSGLQAIVSATQLIQLGDCDTALAGGVEVMSRGHNSFECPVYRTHPQTTPPTY